MRVCSFATRHLLCSTSYRSAVITPLVVGVYCCHSVYVNIQLRWQLYYILNSILMKVFCYHLISIRLVNASLQIAYLFKLAERLKKLKSAVIMRIIRLFTVIFISPSRVVFTLHNDCSVSQIYKHSVYICNYMLCKQYLFNRLILF